MDPQDRNAVAPIRAEINVTPLIDVMLVLLILFMVVTPVATPVLDAHLPDSPSNDESPIAPIVLTVEPGGFRLNRAPLVTTLALGEGLREALHARRDRTVFVRAEGDVTYGRVVEAMDVARGAGAERIGIVGRKR